MNVSAECEDNPLLIDPIVSSVLKFLSVINLKSCRLVCRKWSQLTITELRKKGRFDVKKHLHRIDNWTVQNYLFSCICIESTLMVQHYSSIQQFGGSHLKKIQYKIIDDEYNFEEFQSFMNQCPEVQEVDLIFVITDNPIDDKLDFYDLHQSTLEKIKCIDVNCDFCVESWLPDLIQACPNLQTLKLQLQESRFKRIFEIFSKKSILIENLRHLQVGGITYLFTGNAIENFMTVPWKLTCLRIFVQNNALPEIMRNCFHQMSETLTHLQLSWFCWNENDWENSRESLIPHTLKKLERLGVTTNDNSVQTFLASESLNLIPTFFLPSNYLHSNIFVSTGHRLLDLSKNLLTTTIAITF